MSANKLEARDLTKRFGDLEVLHEVCASNIVDHV